VKLFRNRPNAIIPAEMRFTIGFGLLLLLSFSALRLFLLLRNHSLWVDTPAAILLQSFIVGLRFDLAITAYLLIPLLLLLTVLGGRAGNWLPRSLIVLAAGVLLLGIAEAEFYREFESRFNALVFEYLGHPVIVGGMIWDGYPVLEFLLLWVILLACFVGGCLYFYRRHLRPAAPTPGKGWRRLATNGVFLVLLVFAARGGFASEPLRWGDAFFSQNTFANHLALNGMFTLGRSAWDKMYGKQDFWTKAMPAEEAQATARQMLLLPGEETLADAGHPLLRRQKEVVPPLRSADGQPLNVVVILMESFSARFTGALGSPAGLTPEFDRLAEQGILFERAFSSGTHTHQGVYATLASFPNVPGYEYLMKLMEANQEFSGLPSLLHRQGYRSVFLYNGLFSWDNKEGFFRQHGVDRFVGCEDYVNPTFVDPVWGVSDHDVFNRANEEFRAMAQQGPFLGIVLTLSNHSPFNLPEPLPFARIATGDESEGRFNGMRYADWALGEFFRQAAQEPYFANTLFVVTGDHGFGSAPMITPIQLSRFHVPLLFYAPQLAATGGERRRTVASQVDIAPSILGLLGLRQAHQSWGRNLFSPSLNDPGFAVFKPSGGEEVAALVEDDYLLIVAPKEKPQLFRYSLDFPPTESANLWAREEEKGEVMRKRLLGYIEAGILGLRGRTLGLPETVDQAPPQLAGKR